MPWAQLRTPRTSGAAYAIDRPAGRDHYQIGALYADAHKTPITNPARQRDPVDARDLSRHPRHGQIVRDWSTAPKARGKAGETNEEEDSHTPRPLNKDASAPAPPWNAVFGIFQFWLAPRKTRNSSFDAALV
jgi:hypothetical protein